MRCAASKVESEEQAGRWTVDSKIAELLQAALNRTNRGELKWQAFSGDSFRAKIGPGFLHIQKGSDQVSHDGVEFYPVVTYSIQVSDAQVRVVAEDETSQGNEHYPLLHDLFLAARKSALGSDRVIDEMLDSLLGSAK